MENAYGSDKASKDYCSKESVLLELGSASASVLTQNVWESLTTITSLETASEIDPELAVRCRFQLKDIALQNFLDAHSRPALMSTTLLHEWQASVLKSLLNQNDRKITWVVDTKGAQGKSTLARFLQYHLGDSCFYTTGGKGSDIVHSMVTRQKVFKYVIFDYPRKTKPEFYNWNLFEDFKNGIVNSGKYNSICLQFPSIKVLVLGNHELDDVRDNLTYDRWDVHKLSPHHPIDGVPTIDPKEVFKRTDLFPDVPVPAEAPAQLTRQEEMAIDEMMQMSEDQLLEMITTTDIDMLINE